MSLLTAPPELAVTSSHSQGEDKPLYEIINGLKVDLPPMSFFTVLIASRLQELLGPFVRANHLGVVVVESLFILDAAKNCRRRPDVAFISTERLPPSREIPEEGDLEVVPDLAIEVISPNEQFKDVYDKLLEYFKVGVRQVWLVLSQHRQVHIYDSPTTVRILTDGQELDCGPLLPGLHLPLTPLFSRDATISLKGSN